MMTPEKKLAIAERREYDALSSEERKLYEDIGDFVSRKNPLISSRQAELRGRLLLAGDRADPLWKKVADGLPLSTAARLLREAESEWRRTAADDSRGMDAVLRERIENYERSGVVRRAGGRVFRTAGETVASRAAKIAKGEVSRGTLGEGHVAQEASGKSRKAPARHKTLVREAIAAWIASRMPRGDERTDAIVEDAMREIEVVLDSLSARVNISIPSRAGLFEACDMLNIPRPRWGKRADQERAWKHRKAALRSTHPDTLGHNGGVRAFQVIKDAYDSVVAYNDSLVNRSVDSPQSSPPVAQESQVSKDSNTEMKGSEDGNGVKA